MDGPTLLSGTEIGLIRRYVATKYAHLPAPRRADIVADAVRRAVLRRLPALPEPWRMELAEELIRRCLVRERRDIRREDVLAACAERKWDERGLPEAVAAWMNGQASKNADGAGERSKVIALGPGEDAPTGPGSGSSSPSASKTPGAPAVPSAALVPASPPVPVRIADEPPAESQAAVVPANDAPAVRAEPVWPGIFRRLWPAGGRASPAYAFAAPSAAVFPAAPARPAQSLAPLAWAAATFLLTAGIWLALSKPAQEESAVPADPQLNAHAAETVPEAAPAADAPGMPPELRFAEFDREPVREYLRSRDSILAEEPYFEAIVESAREHDVHPLLLFAIAGQEQGFVPKTHKYAERIANNPFNVHESWEKYNTDIRDSAGIAARTVAVLGSRRPAGYDPFLWLNTRYAEDPNWADGVRWFFEKLVSVAEGRSLPASAATSPSSP